MKPVAKVVFSGFESFFCECDVLQEAIPPRNVLLHGANQNFSMHYDFFFTRIEHVKSITHQTIGMQRTPYQTNIFNKRVERSRQKWNCIIYSYSYDNTAVLYCVCYNGWDKLYILCTMNSLNYHNIQIYHLICHMMKAVYITCVMAFRERVS